MLKIKYDPTFQVGNMYRPGCYRESREVVVTSRCFEGESKTNYFEVISKVDNLKWKINFRSLPKSTWLRSVSQISPPYLTGFSFFVRSLIKALNKVESWNRGSTNSFEKYQIIFFSNITRYYDNRSYSLYSSNGWIPKLTKTASKTGRIRLPGWERGGRARTSRRFEPCESARPTCSRGICA